MLCKELNQCIHTYIYIYHHIFLWGSCFLFCIPLPLLLLRLLFVTHNLLPHNFVTHHLSTQTSHNLLTHTHNFVTHHLSTQTLSQLCHTPSFNTSFTQLAHTHTQLCHTPSSITNFVTTLSHTHTLFHTQLAHTQVCQTPSFTHHIFHPQLCHTPSLRGSGLGLVARLGTRWLPSAPRHFAWQAWHLATSACVLRGRRSAYGTGLGLVALSRSGRRGTLRGRRGTWRHPPALCVAGVALGDIHLHFAWQAQQWAGSGDALGAL